MRRKMGAFLSFRLNYLDTAHNSAYCSFIDIQLSGSRRRLDQSASDRHHAVTRWSLFLFVLVGILLVGSVLLPADESQRVLGLLSEEERLIEPARLLASQLISGVAEESSELQRYVAGGDSLALARYRRAADRDDDNVVAMRRLAAQIGGDVAHDAGLVGGLVERWRALIGGEAKADPSSSSLTATGGRREAVRDSIVVTTASFQDRLADWSAQKRAAVTAHEWRGLVINAVLVCVAMIALAAVFEVMRRERRRTQREAALRLAAETLARAYAVPDVARQVADGAMDLLQPTELIVVHAEPDSRELRVAAYAAATDLRREVGRSYDGSVVDLVQDDGRPIIVPAARVSGDPALAGRAMVIPLGARNLPVGAVIAFEARSRRFHSDDLAWAETFAHLASFSYEKVRLLEEARAGQARLQRAMESRGRLIRGFSHDVKNPLGAADGYAALLQDGIYGAVTDEQRSSIARVRGALHRALSLIDDLHELARAETGRLDIHFEPTDVGALVMQCGDEYRAAAEAKHLQFVIEVGAGLPRAETDASRIRQIVGNLLSNAIKYTDAGSIALRARSHVHQNTGVASHVLIDVQDTGPGIPTDKHELIFQEFARLTHGEHAGAGLGLAISKHVADALGCRVEVLSEVGKGATFTLCVPLLSETAKEPSGGEEPIGERTNGIPASSQIGEARTA
jgi:signal transduction histidine kinase